jgi:hypothetical protein
MAWGQKQRAVAAREREAVMVVVEQVEPETPVLRAAVVVG